MLIDVCIKFLEYSLSGFQVIERTRFVTDRQTDGRPGKNNMSPDPKGGRHNNGTDKQYVAVFCYTIQLISIKLCIKFQNPNLSCC